jgi:hypothetical protein
MSNEEISALEQEQMRQFGVHGVHEFCIEAETSDPKVFGDTQDPPKEHPTDRIRAKLDRATIALHTFKEGRVSYGSLRLIPITFSPFWLGSYGFGQPSVPFGSYVLTPEEIASFRQHVDLIFTSSESSIEMACSRLSDAATRTRSEDQLVDAVIGMEAILLAGLSSEDRRGELKFRFSLNYATLFDSPEARCRAFRIAKDLYNLRSTIAHGSSPGKGTLRVGDEKLALPDAANRASRALRHVIHYFLPRAKEAPYTNHHFWERAYFGLK